MPSSRERRVLLDECLPKRLKRAFVNSAAYTVGDMGWTGKKNGELMKLAQGEFDVFVTADQNVRYQQNLAYGIIAVIILIAPSNRIENLLPLMPQVAKALESIAAGQVMEIS